MENDRFWNERRLHRISEKAKLVLAQDWRYNLFFDYLKISQSYWLADRYRKGLIKRRRNIFPPDFDKILKTYDAFGDVTTIDLFQWWKERAQFKFSIIRRPRGALLMKLEAKETANASDLNVVKAKLKRYLEDDRPNENDRAVIVVVVPIYGQRGGSQYLFDRLLVESGVQLKEPREIYKYSLVPNKIRESMLDMAYRVTLLRAADPDKKLLNIGMEARVSPALYNERTKEWDYEKRRELESLTSRLLRKAYILSENAARGEFPSLSPIAAANSRFDWETLSQQYNEYLYREHTSPNPPGYAKKMLYREL